MTPRRDFFEDVVVEAAAAGTATFCDHMVPLGCSRTRVRPAKSRWLSEAFSPPSVSRITMLPQNAVAFTTTTPDGMPPTTALRLLCRRALMDASTDGVQSTGKVTLMRGRAVHTRLLDAVHGVVSYESEPQRMHGVHGRTTVEAEHTLSWNVPLGQASPPQGRHTRLVELEQAVA